MLLYSDDLHTLASKAKDIEQTPRHVAGSADVNADIQSTLAKSTNIPDRVALARYGIDVQGVSIGSIANIGDKAKRGGGLAGPVVRIVRVKLENDPAKRFRLLRLFRSTVMVVYY